MSQCKKTIKIGLIRNLKISNLKILNVSCSLSVLKRVLHHVSNRWKHVQSSVWQCSVACGWKACWEKGVCGWGVQLKQAVRQTHTHLLLPQGVCVCVCLGAVVLNIAQESFKRWRAHGYKTQTQLQSSSPSAAKYTSVPHNSSQRWCNLQ